MQYQCRILFESYVGTPTVAVHPVAVNVAYLVIVVTKWMPAFLFKLARSATMNDIIF